MTSRGLFETSYDTDEDPEDGAEFTRLRRASLPAMFSNVLVSSREYATPSPSSEVQPRRLRKDWNGPFQYNLAGWS